MAFSVLQGTVQLPGDKSIGHRALMLSLLCPGTHRIINLPRNKDVLATLHCLEQLGVVFEQESEGEKALTVHVPQSFAGSGDPGESPLTLDAQNSGTTMRLLSGLLSGLNLHVQLTGDKALSQRPMGRVISPLQQMGAQITGANHNTTAPITIRPSASGISGIRYTLPVASAQVKSALILAGLFAKGETQIVEPLLTRDHTERMLRFLGVSITSEVLEGEAGQKLTLSGSFQRNLSPVVWHVPGDVSSAAFFIVAALLIPGSHLTLTHMGLNPQRMGLIDALRRVGAQIDVSPLKTVCGEPVGDVVVKASSLKGDLLINETSTPALPALIDEIPILAVVGCFLEGTLEVRGAEELRKKESDRIDAVVREFAKLGIGVEDFADGFRMMGQPQREIEVPSSPLLAHDDHRIAMALTILNLIACSRSSINQEQWPENPWPLEGREWAQVSFPNFYEVLQRLMTSCSENE